MNAIDVVVPAFNAARYLDEALASVLSQDHAANRIIVVDDGSTDGTAEAAARFGAPVEITRRDNGGAGAARNTGIVRSTAAFVAFLDADDRWIARKLTLQMAALNADPAIDLVLCLVRAFASPELPEAERAALEAQQPRPFEGWVAGSMLIRRASFDRVGPFAEDLGVAEGVDWFNRARRAGLSHRVIPEVLLERRLHRHNTTRLHGGRSSRLSACRQETCRTVAQGPRKRTSMIGGGWRPTPAEEDLLEAAVGAAKPRALAAWQSWRRAAGVARAARDRRRQRQDPAVAQAARRSASARRPAAAVDRRLLPALALSRPYAASAGGDLARALFARRRHSDDGVEGRRPRRAYYGDLGLRPMNDFDVLVPREQRARRRSGIAWCRMGQHAADGRNAAGRVSQRMLPVAGSSRFRSALAFAAGIMLRRRRKLRPGRRRSRIPSTM